MILKYNNRKILMQTSLALDGCPGLQMRETPAKTLRHKLNDNTFYDTLDSMEYKPLITTTVSSTYGQSGKFSSAGNSMTSSPRDRNIRVYSSCSLRASCTSMGSSEPNADLKLSGIRLTIA